MDPYLKIVQLQEIGYKWIMRMIDIGIHGTIEDSACQVIQIIYSSKLLKIREQFSYIFLYLIHEIHIIYGQKPCFSLL